MRPSTIPNLSLITLARGARQLVVQEALERTTISLVYVSRLTPQTNMGASAEGAELFFLSVGFRDGVIEWEDKHDDFLGTALQVSRCLLLGCEDTGGLDDILDIGILPWDCTRVTLMVHLDDLSVDYEVVILVARDLALEISVGRVVLEHVDLWSRVSELFPEEEGLRM